jgi:26S proteasome regulatory subunit N1
MMSAAASLGLGLLWDTDVGLSHIDRYTYSPEEWIKVLFTSYHCASLLII